MSRRICRLPLGGGDAEAAHVSPALLGASGCVGWGAEVRALQLR